MEWVHEFYRSNLTLLTRKPWANRWTRTGAVSLRDSPRFARVPRPEPVSICAARICGFSRFPVEIDADQSTLVCQEGSRCRK
jgi:hypothetical protein